MARDSRPGRHQPARPASISTRDGRALAYADYGDPRGTPVFYFHGFPGSRLEASMGQEAARRIGVRLIAVERPGFGWSDHLPGRLITDWPDDVLDLARALGLTRFAVLGVSAGGPYAAACAARIPDHLTAAGIVSGLAPTTPQLLRELLPFNRAGLRLALRAPGVLAAAAPLVQLVTGSAAGFLVGNLARSVAEPDRALLQGSPLGVVLARSFEEAVRHGAAGMVREAILFARPWGEWLSSIGLDVWLWHGERDRVVPAAMGRAMERAIPRCHATYYPDEGHFSLIARHGEEILRTLAGRRAGHSAAPVTS